MSAASDKAHGRYTLGKPWEVLRDGKHYVSMSRPQQGGATAAEFSAAMLALVAALNTHSLRPKDDPYHPSTYRPISRDVMSGAERLGHVITDGYHDHNWCFQPDRRFTDRRPTRARSADPADCLPNWVRSRGYDILPAEESAVFQGQSRADDDAGMGRR